MIMRMYSIHDKLNGYTTPIPINTDELAIRYFKDHFIGNPTIRNSPEDFAICYMGTFDSESGTYIQDKESFKIIRKGVEENGKNDPL